MIATDLVRLTLHTLLAILIFTDQVEIRHLVAIEALFGTAEAFFRPAYTGLVPRTVPEAEIQEAQALSNLTVNLAGAHRPALATALVLGVGAGWAFLLDAATFAVSALLLARVLRRTLRRLGGARGHCSRTWPRAPRGALALTALGDGRGVRAGHPARVRPAVRARPDAGRGGYGTTIFGILTTAFGAGALAGALVGPAPAPRAPDARGLPGPRRMAPHAPGLRR